MLPAAMMLWSARCKVVTGLAAAATAVLALGVRSIKRCIVHNLAFKLVRGCLPGYTEHNGAGEVFDGCREAYSDSSYWLRRLGILVSIWGCC